MTAKTELTAANTTVLHDDIELVQAIDPSDNATIWVLFTDHRSSVAVIVSKDAALESITDPEPWLWDSMEDVRAQGGDYLAAVEAAMQVAPEKVEVYKAA